ncbi:glycosyltransferase family 39 protein [Lacihabitans sp. CCS-44]|uniref:ArnT family glycosyltransferase n=1 Tax=Lacihabitans sp. CCS-44 TaxID=2487331 RepID=UPI0020CE3BAF|nr:glycosyltransferase family 39 protein [Lacihabitans sp. CCS-44]MCP9757330.1 glycosyltransferase family 39 protein [Lacihabitans sp. CCS-44]
MYFTPLFDEDEGFFAEASRQMLATGDFITINVNGEQRYDKPALFFWFTALSLKIFGINELAARLPSFVFFLFTLVLFFGFTKKYFSEKNAILVATTAIGIVQFQVLARAAVSDNLLNLLVAGALIGFYKYQETSQIKTLFWIYTFAGLGFLTKGPIAFVIIFGVILLFLLLTKNLKLLLKILHPLLVAWAFIIPFPWFYMAYQKSGDFLFSDFIIKHNFGRFSQTMESHGGHIWYYLPVLLLSFLPFSHLLFFAFKDMKFDKKNLFLLIWFLFPFVLFSFSKTQLPHYISIGYMPLIVLMGQMKNLKITPVFFQIIILLGLFLAAPIFIKNIRIDDIFVTTMLASSSTIFDKYYFGTITMLSISAIGIFRFSKEKMFPLVLIYFMATTLFIYKFATLQQGFVKETGLKLRKNNETVFMKDHYNPSLSFYAQKVFTIKATLQKGDKTFQKNTLLETKNGYLITEIE